MIKRHFYLILLIVISCLPLLSFLNPGLPDTHDGVDHVARIANFYQSFSEGNLLPRWAGNLNWGYGHPVLMFLYPLPSYLASMFHFLGASFVDSTKLVFVFSFLASGVGMFLWLTSFTNRRAAFLGALAYSFGPYRFVDMYVRGAIGEHVAFIFPPLICLSLLLLATSKKKWPLFLGILSLCGLLLSHNAISLMFFPIFVLYAVFLYVTKKKSREFLLQTVLVFLSGFFLSAFFLGPAFFEGKYTLRDIVTKNEYMNRFETIERFFFGKWNYGGTGQFSVQIGIVQWIAVGLTPLGLFIYRKQKNALWLLCAGSFVLFFTTLFLMTKPSLPLWEVVTILQKFQFPWRLLSVSVFLSGLMVALVVDALKGRISSVLIIVLVAFLFFVNMGFWYPKGYIKNPDIFYSGIYNGTTDTGESAPIWSVRFMEHRAGTSSSVIEGRAEIAQITRSSTRHQYKISADVPSRILENTLYFPGWNVSVNGTNVPLEFQDPRFRGLITYFIPKGESNVQVVFSETKLRLVADFISLGTFVLLLGYAVYLMTQRLWRNSR